MIEGKNIIKRFGHQMVLNDLSFCIPEGTIVGFYGKSGIGKTTLARILCGILYPDSGNVFLNGQPLWNGRSYDRRAGSSIQTVSQQPYASLDPRQRLISGFRELIRFHGFANTDSETEELIGSLAKEVGLSPEILQQLPHQISGGEAQRAVIARSLLFSPELLILDEATSMLDVSTQANIIALVRRAQVEKGRSVMLITHDRELAETLCSRIYFLE